MIKMDLAQVKAEAKMDFVSLVSDLMPAGNPTYLGVIKYPMIKSLLAELGKKTMLKVLFLLVKDFCSSVNVVRNMNQDQMIETAAMLIDECDNFRLEDYAMMFSMAKRGELVKIMDRLDMSVITQMLDEYWKRRNQAALKLEENESLDSLGPSCRIEDALHPLDAKLANSVDTLTGAFGDLKNRLMEWREENKNESKLE
ncbi:hypothetical protein [Segetibacter koreensis]|uniref:hypothetical protein n=1 Tax=Segetibacter koreensis TaxID=398037 RepID=UPI0012F86154|nr:hypothetical protein [Segetibacter koreensis]